MGVCDYFCSYCERKFFDKYNLERHVNASHTKKQQYSCTLVMYTPFILLFFVIKYITICKKNLPAKISNLLLIIYLFVCSNYSALIQHFCMIHWNVTKNWNTVITQEQNLSALFVIMLVLQNMIWMYIHTLMTKLNHTCEYFNDKSIYEHQYLLCCVFIRRSQPIQV